jgi:threonine/homoserine efflux transporter RhtA
VAALAAGVAMGTITAALVSLPFGASGAEVSLRVAAVALIVAAGALARARAVTRQARAEWRRKDRRAASVSTPTAERLRIAA